MKVTTLFFLFAVWVFFTPGNGDSSESCEVKQDMGVDEEEEGEEELHCEKYNLPACPKQIDPICGTDGKTYANECILCIENLKRTKKVGIEKLEAC